MKLDRKLRCGFNRCNEFLRRIREQKTRHIFNANRIRSHRLDFLRNIHPIVHGVRISKRINQRHLRMTAFFFTRLYRSLQISHVIETVKNSENINPVCNGFLDEIFNDIIRVMLISQNILPSKEHLQLCFFEAFPQLSKSHPGIFL